MGADRQVSAARLLVAAIVLAACSGAPATHAACGRDGGSDPVATVTAALLAYQDANGALPPAYVADPMGVPLLSWRVLLLPYLGHADLYQQFDLTRAWDDPVNYPLREQMPFVYGSLADRPFTVVSGVAGSRTAFTGAVGVPTGAMTDGVARTPLVGTIASPRIIWTAPQDVDTDQFPAFSHLTSFFWLSDCARFGMADGSLRVVSAATPVADLAAFYDRADGAPSEPIDCLTAPPELVLLADDMRIRGPVAIVGDLWAARRLLLSKGNGTVVSGDVVAGERLDVRGGNTILGDAVSGGTLRVAGDATVAGAAVAGRPMVRTGGGSGSIGIGGGSDVQVRNGETLSLPPGNYGRLVVGRDATLHLGNDGSGPGYVDYVLRGELRVGTRGRLVIDVGNGPVNIQAGDGLRLGRAAQVALVPNGAIDADDVCFYNHGDVRIGPDALFLGHLFGGKVVLKSGTHVRGRLSADRLVIGRDGHIVDLDAPLD